MHHASSIEIATLGMGVLALLAGILLFFALMSLSHVSRLKRDWPMIKHSMHRRYEEDEPDHYDDL